MSQEVYYPILRGSDVDSMLHVAGQLVRVGGGQSDIYVAACMNVLRADHYLRLFDQCTLGLRYRAAHEKQVAEALGSAAIDIRWTKAAHGKVATNIDFTEKFAGIVAALPDVEASLAKDGVSTPFLAEFVEVLDNDRGSVDWLLPGWPGVVDESLEPRYREAGVLLVLNADSIQMNRSSDTSVLYVTVGSGDNERRRAEWLAQRVGHAVIGSPESD